MMLASPANARDVYELIATNQFAQAQAKARDAKAPLLESYARWAELRDAKTPTPIDFSDGYSFLVKHSGWPDEKLIRLRTEEAALQAASSSGIKHFCSKFPPISGRGMFACTGVTGTDAQRREWIREGWKNGDFSEAEETRILETYGKHLTQADHRARMERLLFEEKTAQARRMLPLLPRDEHTLYLATMALINNDHDAAKRLDAVPVNLRRSALLTLARIEWRAARNDEVGVRELFLNHPYDPPYANQWWKYRALAARAAMEAGQYESAHRIVRYHGDLKPENLAEALFLKGWIALTYLEDARDAYKDFYRLYTLVTTPVSKARAAYWAAMAAKRNGNTEIHQQWLEKAASRPFVFYGQLAFAQRYPNKPLPVPSAPQPSAMEVQRMESEEMVKLIRMLSKQGQQEVSERFLKHLAETTSSPTRLLLLAKLARETVGKAGSVRIAKQALRKGVVLVDAGWPKLDLPEAAAIEPALALAIIRQESEFDQEAISPAGARGLMQLMPATAREVARRNDWDHQHFVAPTMNMRLGTQYLGDMIDAMGGSYVLGIAAYNAGPGNVRDWRKTRGHPGQTPEDAIRWIETIPFSETRNYVMRVLENLQIYRRLLDANASPKLAEDLVRG